MHRAVLTALLLFSPPVQSAQEEQARGAGGTSTFENKVKPFLTKYCIDCHNTDNAEANVSFENLGEVSVENASHWKRAWERVALKEMPPRKETNQPDLMERLEVSRWITDGMAGALKTIGGFIDHLRP